MSDTCGTAAPPCTPGAGPSHLCRDLKEHSEDWGIFRKMVLRFVGSECLLIVRIVLQASVWLHLESRQGRWALCCRCVSHKVLRWP